MWESCFENLILIFSEVTFWNHSSQFGAQVVQVSIIFLHNFPLSHFQLLSSTNYLSMILPQITLYMFAVLCMSFPYN